MIYLLLDKKKVLDIFWKEKERVLKKKRTERKDKKKKIRRCKDKRKRDCEKGIKTKKRESVEEA